MSVERQVPHVVERLNVGACSRAIQLTNESRTATHAGWWDRPVCVLGIKMYIDGQHDVHIRLDEVNYSQPVVIGMTSNPDPPLDEFIHFPGLRGWHSHCLSGVAKNGEIEFEIDVGQPWENGDFVRLHLDCGMHTLSVCHERTGKSHTHHYVTGAQSLFISMTATGTAVSLISD